MCSKTYKTLQSEWVLWKLDHCLYTVNRDTWYLHKIFQIPHTRHVTNAIISQTTGCNSDSCLLRSSQLYFFRKVARPDCKQDQLSSSGSPKTYYCLVLTTILIEKAPMMSIYIWVRGFVADVYVQLAKTGIHVIPLSLEKGWRPHNLLTYHQRSNAPTEACKWLRWGRNSASMWHTSEIVTAYPHSYTVHWLAMSRPYP